MRVISGTYKGRVLKAVPGTSTRPTTDKVKESIFNMVGPYFEGGTGLDLYAGSGGLGIEALSRGFDRFIFVDRDFKAIQTVKGNLKTLGLEKRADVYRNDAERALHALVRRGASFDAVFLDPPYREQKLEALLSMIDEADMLTDRGFIVAEHAKEVMLPDAVGGLQLARQEIYGLTGVTIYRKRGNGDG
ncbi:16S rRNA (guanine(966)-N(2))-methyltransferase RsmD [Bacillus haynesii]|uniref:16S rRNA (guanine(966)-N(2))-methyltransferase RsmD n=1 Tax=Bacillus haynesii TaxID=1925021 RepID=UPI0022826F79|nr:16S rRNA (guanine(966)-N(2))-methyltransferase RsmD [Bacillus haynesii]MCY8143957.1 16S rRNA (guanine(966)-N(2))-methyltransferase RsmD [Bacillus haynesii]MCY8678285.1 16S rRNA (guanine(966)-N(2))-methyltransferase RsmD [Bacillus haynesii]MCY9244943.1 16S rRNA (guanine(966)-N(2))-methyltransferase RsmD [Bacillus haynesii]MCY9321377.1 16S rRNA (guanine(966)-N(2))-methyltransferase RsmD [Bacillus haynesii]MEC1455151.1 16S rRNA (guanine(966)-N(2))-methyltransferase RsmD [Bacillus haynesii]